MDEQTGTYPYDGKLLRNKNKWTTDICNHTVEHQIHYVKEKKPDTKGYILYNTIQMTSWNRQNLQEQKADKLLPKSESGGGDDSKGAGEKLLEWRKYFTSWLWCQLHGYAFVKT